MSMDKEKHGIHTHKKDFPWKTNLEISPTWKTKSQLSRRALHKYLKILKQYTQPDAIY